MSEEKRKILIVDDVELFVQLQKTIISRADFEILTAKSGEEALRTAREEKPDLVLLDLFMPDINGDVVCRLLKEDPATRDTPVLIITTEEVDEHRDLCRDAGCDGYLTKPIRRGVLMPAIERHLDMYPRRHRRIRTQIDCTVTGANCGPTGVIHTLSPYGAFIELSPPPIPGTSFDVAFALEDDSDPMHLTSLVRWTRQLSDSHPDGVGCEFLETEWNDYQLIRDYVLERMGEEA
jgi:CheY-like chemotaxis protein